MTSTLSPGGAGAASALAPAPTFDATVSRHLVHRWSLSEVFLTSFDRVDDERFVCGAQLPITHAYFRDHPADVVTHDPLQIMEACRQAVTCAAHLHQDLPRETTFMVRTWALHLLDPAMLTFHERASELRIDGTIAERHVRAGHVRRVVLDMAITLDGRPAGTVAMDVACAPTPQYHMLRRRQRGTDPATAFTEPAIAAATPVPPADVGRIDERNSVLDGMVRAGEGLTAVLSPRTFRNRSMYDHPYDHVPAMVLSEAARQSAILLSPTTPLVRTLDGRFAAFAELDAPVGLTARLAPGRLTMTALQGATTVAELDLALA